MLRMDRITLEKHKRLNHIVDFLNMGEMSVEDFDSTQEPFFAKGETQDFKQNFKTVPELPEGLNRNFRDIYEIIGNPRIEVSVKTTDNCEWTIMSIVKALDVYEEYRKGGQECVFDLAFTYMGMGHINVLACDLETHNLFVHPAGGSNGWDREANHTTILNYNRDNYEQFYFTTWLKRFL
jgi:hypothetical protein